MISEYVQKFDEAYRWTNSHTDERMNYPFRIDPSLKLDMKTIVAVLAKDFAEFIKHTDMLPGRCFLLARELSYVMFDLKIRHTVTIGDIQLPDGMYVGLSHASLKKELEDGYVFDTDESGKGFAKPANAHAWITLENGQIIDATILASRHRKSGKEGRLSFEEAFYHFDKPGAPELKHIPFMTGLAYHYNVLFHPMDELGRTYSQWFETYFGFMNFMDGVR